MRLNHLPRREFERLSAYLDGELSPRQARKLEARLARDPGLRRALQELQQVVAGMRTLPQHKPPRSFILRPEAVGAVPRRGSYPFLRLATALAAFAFLALVGVDLFSGALPGALSSRAAEPVAMEAPAAGGEELLDSAADEAMESDALLESAPADFAGAAEPAPEVEAETLGLAGEPEAPQEEAPMKAEPSGEEARAGEAQEGAPPAADETLPMEGLHPLSGEGAAENDLEPMEAPSPERDEQPAWRVSPSVLWLRGLQIGLAALTAVLALLTLRARTRR